MRCLIVMLLALFVCDALAPAALRCQSGEAVFQAHCARCHGTTGTTDTPMARVLKVAPLVDDARLARLTTSEIVQLVKSDPKHSGVVHVGDSDLSMAAQFVKELAQRPNPVGTGEGRK